MQLEVMPSSNSPAASKMIWAPCPLEVPFLTCYRAQITSTHTQAVQRNGSVYMHVLFTQAGATLDRHDPEYNEDLICGSVHSQ